MKKIILAIIVLALNFSSCNKQDSIITANAKSNFEQELTQFDLNFRTQRNFNALTPIKKTRQMTDANKRRLKIAVEDAAGALQGAEFGMVGGLFGSVCGALAWGAYMSCLLGGIAHIPPNNTNTNIENTGVYFIGTQIDIATIGNLHNTALNNVYANQNIYGSSNIDSNILILNYCKSITTNSLGCTDENLTTWIASCQSPRLIEQNIEDPLLFFANGNQYSNKFLAISTFYNMINTISA
jgi:hypothetical protein